MAKKTQTAKTQTAKTITTSRKPATKATPAETLPPVAASEPINESSFVSVDNLQQLDDDLRPVYEAMMADWQEQALSPKQRLQMLGSGVRRYGFNDKVSDFAESNPEFIPPYLNVPKFKRNIRETEMLRDISAMLAQMQRITDDLLLITGDEVYRQALMYYNTVRDASRRRVPGADALYRILEQYFKRRKNTSEEPTEQQIMHDVKGLLHGTKEGEVIIKNTGKKTTKGKKIVVDETTKPKGHFKETESGEVDE